MRPNLNSRRAGFRSLATLLVVLLLLQLVPAAVAEDKDTVTVYFTLSNDGIPVMGADGTILSRVRVEVPYFDLALYDLQDYYRYESDGFENGGSYISGNVVEKPTVLHLYLYMLERYYMGLDDADCCQGNLDMDYSEAYYDREGNELNASNADHALTLSGGSTSMYMVNFWGHDENLMYYVDHQYPLMAAGWGSTADYILLEDGMCIDVAMFSNWSFWTYGAFAFFDRDEYYVEAGRDSTYAVYKTETVAGNDGSSLISTPIEGLVVKVFDEDGTQLDDYSGETTDENGKVTLNIAEAGEYQITAEDPNIGTDDSCYAPAVATLHVVDELPDLTGIELNIHEAELDPAEPLTLKATITPENVPNVTYTWTSSDEEVAHVSEIGVVKTFLDNTTGGTAIITCTATDSKGNSVSDSCTVKVKGSTKVTGVSLTDSNVEMSSGSTYQLTPVIEPADASQQTVQWRTSEQPDFSENPTDAGYTIVKVDKDGLLTARSEGVVTVYVKTDDGDFTASCRVAVDKKFGDADGDGKVNNKDAMLSLGVVLGNSTDSIDSELVDMDGNGKINNKDVMMILNRILGK